MRRCLHAALLAAALLVTGVFLPGRAVAADAELKQFTVDEVEKVLRRQGYSAIEKQSDILLLLSINGTRYGIFVDDDGDIQGYFGIEMKGVSLEWLNEWNKSMRFSRAYLDEGGDPVLEADLDATKGVSEEQLAWFVKLFVDSVELYQNHLKSEKK